MTYCAISVSAGSNLVSLCHPTLAFYIFKMSQLKSLFLPSIGQNHPSKEKRWKVKAAINHKTKKSSALAVSIMYSRIHPDCVHNCHSILKTMSRIPLTCLIQCNQNKPDVLTRTYWSRQRQRVLASRMSNYKQRLTTVQFAWNLLRELESENVYSRLKRIACYKFSQVNSQIYRK